MESIKEKQVNVVLDLGYVKSDKYSPGILIPNGSLEISDTGITSELSHNDYIMTDLTSRIFQDGPNYQVQFKLKVNKFNYYGDTANEILLADSKVESSSVSTKGIAFTLSQYNKDNYTLRIYIDVHLIVELVIVLIIYQLNLMNGSIY